VASTSIADIVALIGGPGLDDGTSDARHRFTAFLCQSKWDPEDIRGWVDECLELASRVRPEFYYALQDLIVSTGHHLGFEVEFGSYTGSGVGIPYDGKWHALTGEEILVEVKSSPWPLGSVSQLGQYMDTYAEMAGRNSAPVYGLYVIGYGDFSGLVDQIRGSEYRNRIKVISFGDLMRLFGLHNLLQQHIAVDRVYEVLQDLLMPFESINVGGVIEIIQSVACSALPDNGSQAASQALGNGRGWGRSELRRFLDECQPNQLAMLLALCSVASHELAAEEMVRRMRLLAPCIPGLEESQEFTTKTIGGARSGLSKREQQLGKDSVLESHNSRYGIREEYREWIGEWFTDRGLLPLRVDMHANYEGLFTQASEVNGG
jgi:hypothetical protein